MMNNLRKLRIRYGNSLLLLAVLWGFAGLGFILNADVEPEGLQWDMNSGRVDANIDGRDIPAVLREVAKQTGWVIYLEPGEHRNVITRFKNKPAGEALERLLGDLSYALLPQQNGPSKLMVYQTSAAGATELITLTEESKPGDAEPKEADIIGNELIVTLKKGSNQSIESIAKALGAKIVGRLDYSNTYRLAFEDDDAASRARQLLSENDAVESINDNYRIPLPANPQALSHSSAMPPRLKAAVPPEGDVFIVGLVDAGFDPKGTSIQDFILPQVEVAGEFTAREDQLSHGLAMAETILRGLELMNTDGLSTVRIQPVDVYGPNLSTTTYDVAVGIGAAISQGARIINLSLGSSQDTPYMEQLIQQYSKEGILFISAAGNEPVATPTFPSAYDPVIAVTSGNRYGELSSFANFSESVDVIAPGGSIVHDNENRAFFGTGTSFSSAYISGVAGGMAESGKDLSQVEKEIRETFKFEKKD